MKHIDLTNMTTTRRNYETNSVDYAIPLNIDPLPSNYYIFHYGDTHEGNAATCDKSINTFIADVRSRKRAWCIHDGDTCESIGPWDKRYSVDVHGGRASRIQAQRDAFLARFDAIADRHLVICDGNHERKLNNTYRVNEDIAKSFGCVYANGPMVKIITEKFRMAIHHGFGRVARGAGDEMQRRVNALISLKRGMRRLPVQDCHYVGCGHHHTLAYHPPSDKQVLVSEHNKLKHYYQTPAEIPIGNTFRLHDDDRHWVCAGSFLRGYMEDMDTYVEDFGLEASELGYVRIEVKNDKLYKIEPIAIQ